MTKNDVPNISPAFSLFQDSAVQLGKGEQTAYIAKKCFKVVSFIRSSSVVITSTIPGKSTSQNGPEVIILSVKVVEMEFELS